jgi:hypothetical protein
MHNDGGFFLLDPYAISFFLCVIAVATTSSAWLIESGESGQSGLVTSCSL